MGKTLRENKAKLQSNVINCKTLVSHSFEFSVFIALLYADELLIYEKYSLSFSHF